MLMYLKTGAELYRFKKNEKNILKTDDLLKKNHVIRV